MVDLKYVLMHLIVEKDLSLIAFVDGFEQLGSFIFVALMAGPTCEY